MRTAVGPLRSEPREFNGQNVTVMGLGRFGGGLGAARFLLDRGARVTISDRRTEAELADSLRLLRASPDDRLSLHLGEHRESDFDRADLIVVNPAVRPDHPLIEHARRRGIAVTTELNLFWQRCPAQVIGVTGTNGKSTTTNLIHHLLECSGRRAWLGGNIGGSLLPQLGTITPTDWVVLELSSFQLAALNELQVSPRTAVVTNFAPNHLDWHGTLDAYRDAKQSTLRWQQASDTALLNARDEVAQWKSSGRSLWFVGEECAELLDRIKPPALRQPHHRENCAAAVSVARQLEISESSIEDALGTFSGLPHRLESIGKIRERFWYNDSASTTPESTLAALTSFPDPIVLLAGGADKGVDLTPLARGIVRRARVAILMGLVAEPLRNLILAASQEGREAALGPLSCVTVATSLPQAVALAVEHSRPGESIVLSPGCASFGWFANFVERGQAFAAEVRAWA